MTVRRNSPLGAEWSRLLQRIAAGDDEALAALYDESASLVYGVVRRIVWDVADAEEITGEIFGHVWSRAGSYEARLGSAAAWLLTLARNRAVDHLRRRRRTVPTRPIDEIGDVGDEFDLDQLAQQEQVRRRVRGALAGLRPEQRSAVELAFFSGLSHVEIARRLELPVGTVKTRIRLGMQKLQLALADQRPTSESEGEG